MNLGHGSIIEIREISNRGSTPQRMIWKFKNGKYGAFPLEKEMLSDFWGDYWNPWCGLWDCWDDFYRYATSTVKPKPSGARIVWGVKIITKENKKMNEIIMKMYPQTKDAVVVEKWFGNSFDNPVLAILAQANSKDILEEALRLEKQEIEKGKK